MTLSRRSFLRASAVGITAGLAGCDSGASGGERAVEYQAEGNAIFGVARIEGTIENTGDVDIDAVQLTCTIYDSDNNALDEQTVTVTDLAVGEEKSFECEFNVGLQNIDHFDIDHEFGG